MEVIDKPFMKSDEICNILMIRKNTLHSKRWRKGVRIPVFRLGKYILIKRVDFWNWFEKRARTDV